MQSQVKLADIKKLVSIAEAGLAKIQELYQEEKKEVVEKKLHTETAVADLRTGELLVERIKEVFGEDIRILVEETAPKTINIRGYDFIVDPIDCTRGFIHNHPGTGVAIAMVRDGQVMASVIGQIVASSAKNEFLHDIVCGGFTHEGWQAWSLDQGSYKPISTSDITNLADGLIYVEMDAFDVSQKNFTDGLRLAEYFMPPRGIARALRIFGSSSLGFMLLGRGSVAVTTGSRKPWDFIPGIPLVLGAGGSYFFYEDPQKVPRICEVANVHLLQYAKDVHISAGMKILEGGISDVLENIPSV